jgi:hypothetical protein
MIWMVFIGATISSTFFDLCFRLFFQLDQYFDFVADNNVVLAVIVEEHVVVD